MAQSRQRTRDLIGLGDSLFAKRAPILSLWQQTCENFHVMRADFTRNRFFSEEFASFLMTGRPALAHRSLTNSIPALMRPRDRQWLWARTDDERINEAREPRAYMDAISRAIYRAMYHGSSGFVRSCKEADGDYAAIGNAVLTIEPNKARTNLLQRCWHPRDVVWAEGYDLKVNEVHHKKKLSVRDLCGIFPNSVAPQVSDAKAKEPNKEIDCRRIVVPSDEYDLLIRNKDRFPFVLIDLDIENDTILAEIPARTLGYVIPRWATISGSQYAYSMATVYALPDARMLQQITLTMLEAGQKATDPPMIAVTEAINGGVNVGAGMITWTDADYDERTGEVLRPMEMRFDGIKFGAEREDKITGTIDATFFLNDLRMPQVTKEMTAYEASKLYEDFTRNSLPLLEPIEVDYNGALASEWFEGLQNLGGLGSPMDVPQALRGADFHWDFDTPLKAAAEQQKVFGFQTVTDIIAKGMQVDKSVVFNLDVNKATRDAVIGAGGADWLVDERQAATARQQQQQQDQAAAEANAMATHADTATKVATAVQSAGEAGKTMQGMA